jgi:hypothetical protein
LLVAGLAGRAQVGGDKVFRFLDLPMTARAAALGGSNMSIWGDDVQLIYSNPALLNPSMSKQVAMDFCNFVGDLKYGFVTYAHALKNRGTLAGSVQFFDYGKFQGYDELGQIQNTFRASDYSINLHYAKAMADSMFNVGIALKTIISQYDVYQSIGNAIDFGITYRTKNRLVLSILARNIGFIWKTYTETPGQTYKLPFSLQFGVSYKVAKAPFRLFLVYDQLQRWRMDYVSPIDTAGQYSSLDQSTQDTTSWQNFTYKTADFLDNMMRHVVIGTEIILSKNFHVRVAYNYRRQKEMTLPERRGVNGLSLGFGFRIKRLGFSYAFTKMAFPGNSSIFGLTLQL